MLHSSHSQVKQEAIWVIVNLSVLPENEGALIMPEVLEPLVALLQADDTFLQEQAAWALGNVSSNARSKMTIINLGALGALQEHRESPDLQVLLAIRPHARSLTQAFRNAVMHLGLLDCCSDVEMLQVASNKALLSLCQVLTPLSRRVYIQERSSGNRLAVQRTKAARHPSKLCSPLRESLTVII